jgi:DNA-binding NarL/FixJ family response regulator
VLVGDPDPFARRSLSDTLQRAPGLVVVAGGSDAREVVELARFYRPDVLVMAVGLPDREGVAVTRQLGREVPDLRVVLLAAPHEEADPVAALRAGAAGYLSKDIEPTALARAVRKVAEGEAAISRELTMRLIELVRAQPDIGWRPLHSRLTTREWEIVDLLGAGASTEAIAGHLVLSPSTVYSHVQSVMRKLGVHSRGEAIAAAQRLRRVEAARAAAAS